MATGNNHSQTLRFHDGAVQFRQRVVASLLSHKPLLVRNIRSDDLGHPGLKDYEASFLRLIDRITNGSSIEINSTGTQLRFKPGTLTGSDDVYHECPPSRSIGWFLEGILPLAPFGKEPLRVTFAGITDGSCEVDPSVDYWKKSIEGLFREFGIGTDADEEDPPTIEILQRAAAPTTSFDASSKRSDQHEHTGKVRLVCPIVKPSLTSIDWTDPGMIKRIRGNAISCKIVSSSMAARVAYAAKGVFHRLLPDVWIHTDVHTIQRNRCGPDPGMMVVVWSESTTGVTLTAECCLSHHNRQPSSSGGGGSSSSETQQSPGDARGKELPEELGTRVGYTLLEEIRRGGCIDTASQSLAFLWMALTPEDVSRIRVGTLSQYSIETLRLIKEAFGVEFRVTPDVDSKTVLLSCLGNGYRNMARAST